MIWLIANPITRALAKLAKLAALVLAVLTFGAWSRFKGAAAERDRQAEERAAARAQTVERVNAETESDDPVADLRQRMRDRARKP